MMAGITLPKGWDWSKLLEWLGALKGLGKIIAVEQDGESYPAKGTVAMKLDASGGLVKIVVKAKETATEGAINFVLTVPAKGKPTISFGSLPAVPCSFRLKEGVKFGLDGITVWLKYVAKTADTTIAFRTEAKVGLGDLLKLQ